MSWCDGLRVAIPTVGQEGDGHHNIIIVERISVPLRTALGCNGGTARRPYNSPLSSCVLASSGEEVGVPQTGSVAHLPISCAIRVRQCSLLIFRSRRCLVNTRPAHCWSPEAAAGGLYRRPQNAPQERRPRQSTSRGRTQCRIGHPVRKEDGSRPLAPPRVDLSSRNAEVALPTAPGCVDAVHLRARDRSRRPSCAAREPRRTRAGRENTSDRHTRSTPAAERTAAPSSDSEVRAEPVLRSRIPCFIGHRPRIRTTVTSERARIETVDARVTRTSLRRTLALPAGSRYRPRHGRRAR